MEDEEKDMLDSILDRGRTVYWTMIAIYALGLLLAWPREEVMNVLLALLFITAVPAIYGPIRNIRRINREIAKSKEEWDMMWSDEQ